MSYDAEATKVDLDKAAADVRSETFQPSTKQEAPKVLIQQTDRAKKLKKAPPVFTDGELFPWKGVWFRLRIAQDGTDQPVFIIEPKKEEVKRG